MSDIPKNLDTILHIGAGQGEELPAYLASDAQRILLVEPNPTLAEALRCQAEQDARVQVLELAVTNDESLNQLNEYNLPEAASLYRPTGLRNLYPGLRITAQHRVNTQTPEQLLAQCPLKGERNLLVIQTPGAELAIIKALARAQKLEAISHILLTNPSDVFYEGAARADDTLDELKRLGYSIQLFSDLNSDWPQWALMCDPLARKAQALEREKQSLIKALENSKSEFEHTKSSLDTVKAELAGARNDFDHEQQAWQTQKQELTTRLENAMQHSGEMDNTVAKLQERELEMGAALSQSNVMVSQLRNELEDTREQLNTLEAKHENDLNSEREQAQARQQALEAAQAKQAELEHQLKQTRDAKQAAEQKSQARDQKLQQLENTNAELTQQLEQLTQTSEERQKQLETAKSTHTELTQQRDQARKQAEDLKTERDQAHKHSEDLKVERDQARKHSEDIKAERDQARKHSEEIKAERDQARQQLETTKTELKQAHDAKQQQQKAREQAEQRTEDLAQKVKHLEQQLTDAQAGQTQFNELKQRMEYLFDQQGLQLEQASNALGRHVTSTAKSTARELQAGIALQQQLGADCGLEEQGNRLPATVALQLSRQIKIQPYDLIIEMGSGVTTSFLAHTLRKQAQNDDDDSEPNGTRVSRYVEPSDDDLPKRILCFEHNRATVKELEQKLKQSSLSPIITLQYAPLVTCHYQGREYLYYDCARRLQQVAQLFEHRDARILVLLNDTTGDSRPDREAALPQLLQYLSAHSLDVVINSASADSELVTQWHQLLDSRGLDYQPATEFGSAAAQLVKVNP